MSDIVEIAVTSKVFMRIYVSFEGKNTIQESSGLITAPHPVIYITARSDSLNYSKKVFQYFNKQITYSFEQLDNSSELTRFIHFLKWVFVFFTPSYIPSILYFRAKMWCVQIFISFYCTICSTYHFCSMLYILISLQLLSTARLQLKAF